MVQSKGRVVGAEGSHLKVKAHDRKQTRNGTKLFTLKVTYKATPLQAPQTVSPTGDQASKCPGR